MNVALYPAAFKNFRTLFGFDVAENLTSNLDLANFDVSSHNGMLSDYERVIATNRPSEIAIDMECAAKVQLTADARPLVQKSQDFVGLFDLVFHICGG